MANTLYDALEEALEDLGENQFKKFTHKLTDPGFKERMKANAVENKDRGDIARLMIQQYTDQRALEFALQILRNIKANQTAADLEKNAAGFGFSVSAGSGRSEQAPVPQAPVPRAPVPQDLVPQDPGHQIADDSVEQGPAGTRGPLARGLDLPDTSGMLILSSPLFKQTIISEKGEEMYDVRDKGVRKRLALIINNVEFKRSNMRRNGAQKDEQNMEKLLRALGYDIVKHRNLSGTEMDKAVKSFAGRSEHAESDSTFVVIMSHGKRDKILGINHGPDNPEDFFPVDNIYTYLNTENCPALLNKPKVILIQACRGGKTGGAWVADSECDEEWDFESDSTYEHKEKDFISLLSCTPDTKAYRDPVNGALFVGYLVQVFNTNSHKDDVEELFRQIMRRFEKLRTCEIKQMVCKERSTMTKLFYLFPGL